MARIVYGVQGEGRGHGRLVERREKALHVALCRRIPLGRARPAERGLVYEVGTSPQDPKRGYFRAEKR